MAKFTVTHEINCNADKFWSLFFDKSFQSDLYKKILGYSEYTVLEQTETESNIFRKATMLPKVNYPGPIQKLLGSNFRYVEEGTFNKATKVWTWKRIPSTLADKLRVEGVLRIEPIGDTKIRCIAEWFIEAKIFGVGGLMESSFEKNAREEEDSISDAINKKLVNA